MSYRTHAVIMALLLCGWTTLTEAVTYYVSPGAGSDTNNGAQATPWKTINRVASATGNPKPGPGDTVYFCAGACNGTGVAVYTKAQTFSTTGVFAWRQGSNHGSAGLPLTLAIMPGEDVTFDGQRNTYFIQFQPNGTGPHSYYIILDGFKFINFTGVAIGILGTNTTVLARHITLKNTRHSTFYHLATGATFAKQAENIIFKNNYFFNIGDITYNDSDPGQHHPIYIADDTKAIVVDSNWIEKAAGYAIHNYAGPTTTRLETNIIMRQNIIKSWRGAANILSCDCSNVYIYHNTLVATANPFPQIPGNSVRTFTNRISNGTLSHIRMFNNIITGPVTEAHLWYDLVGTVSNFQSNYNIWRNTTTLTQPVSWAAADGAVDYHTLALFWSQHGQEQYGKIDDPLFVSEASKNYQLQPLSPARNAGRTLTTTTNSGNATTTLTVDDAGFFHDGYGMLVGDTIRIAGAEPSETAVIATINYTTKTLTLSAARTWSNGVAVSYAPDSSWNNGVLTTFAPRPYQGLAPDLGANEYQEAENAPVVAIATADGIGVGDTYASPDGEITTLAGTASDADGNNTLTSSTWACSTGCTGSGDAAYDSGAGTWELGPITLVPLAMNTINVTVSDGTHQASDSVAVTYTPATISANPSSMFLGR